MLAHDQGQCPLYEVPKPCMSRVQILGTRANAHFTVQCLLVQNAFEKQRRLEIIEIISPDNLKPACKRD